jgi:hypothetical protein
VVAIFTAKFLKELDDKSPLSAAIEGYQRDLACLVETAAPDIAAWLQPEIKTVDLGSVEGTWYGLGLHPLPEDFDWKLVAQNVARSLRQHVKHNPNLRAELEIAVAEEIPTRWPV